MTVWTFSYGPPNEMTNVLVSNLNQMELSKRKLEIANSTRPRVYGRSCSKYYFERYTDHSASRMQPNQMRASAVIHPRDRPDLAERSQAPGASQPYVNELLKGALPLTNRKGSIENETR